METHHDAEKARPSAPCGPEQFRIFPFVGMHQRAIGENDINADHTLARQPQRAAVPTKAALQQETAHADRIGMCDRKEEFMFYQRRIEFPCKAARANDCNAIFAVDRDTVQPRQIKQHPAVANVVLRPAMPA